jgi:hypothetical protein
MGDTQSSTYDVNVGIPQGSPLSPILYLFYNADLLELATSKDVQTSGWIDDVYFFTRGTSTEQNCRNLERAHRSAEQWARTHGSKFAPIKYQLIHFTRSKTKFNTAQGLKIIGVEVLPATTAKYLGILLDAELKWDVQIQHVQEKATPRLLPLATLAGSTWGAGLTQLRRIYQAITIPAILYGCSAWYTLKNDHTHYQTRLQSLGRIQARAARIIGGAYWATSSAALDVETYLMPMKQLLETRLMEALLRIESNRVTDTIRKARQGEGIGNGYLPSGWRPWDFSPLERIDKLVNEHINSRTRRP